MENKEITPMSNPPKFDPKTERLRYFAVRGAGAIWFVILISYTYLFVHWLQCQT